MYQGNFNVNSFSGERQLSAIGMLNNTNKQGFSFMDILNFTGGLPGAGGRGGGMQVDMNSMGLPIQGANNNQGITTTKAGGLNYNNSWQKNLDVMSSYFYNRLQTEKTEKVYQQWLLPGNNFNTTKENNSGNTNESHRINISGDYKIDSTNSLKLASSVNLQQSQYNINSNYNSMSTAGNLLNDGYANLFVTGKGYNWNNSALFRHRFAKKGRTFSANLSVNLNNTKSNGGLQSLNNYYLPDGSLQQSDTINQANNQYNDSKGYGAVLSYTEPLSKKSLLEFNYNFNATRSTSEKRTFDFDKPSGKYAALNDALSNNFSSDYIYNRPTLSWRNQQKKYNFTIGAAVQQASLNSKFHIMAKDSAIERSFVNFLPNANVQYKINQYKNIRVFYNTFTRAPSVTQLQPLTDNSDPLTIKIVIPD